VNLDAIPSEHSHTVVPQPRQLWTSVT
jgi:hypothetical protein